MARKSLRVKFENERGIQLAGILDLSLQDSAPFAVFSHCFTCGKDLKAIVRISRALAERGISVLRYDATGLGHSHGRFSETNFTTTCADLQAAVDYLVREFTAPQLLIGHSFGGAASMFMARRVASVDAVVALAAPPSTLHLANYLDRANPEIQATGEGSVEIGGRTYTIRRQLLEDLRSTDLEAAIGKLDLPLMVMHSPVDDTLPFELGLKIFELARGPKCFITLDGSDHLFVDKAGDPEYIAGLITAWTGRWLVHSG